MIQNLRIAWRDLGRNRRRSFFSSLALALGLALLIFFSGMVNGMVDDSNEDYHQIIQWSFADTC